jgi:hypothetical protein
LTGSKEKNILNIRLSVLERRARHRCILKR